MDLEADDEDIVAGGDVDRVAVTLRVAGDDLDPDTVTRRLLVAPSFAARKGDERRSAGRTVRQRTGVWTLRLDVAADWTLGVAMERLLDQLPAPGPVWDELATRYRLEVFCALYLQAWNRGFVLEPEQLARMAERRLVLGVDVYCNSGERR